MVYRELTITLRGIFLLGLLSPSLAQAYTESFYVCNGGNGSAPETANCATSYDERDFNTADNWGAEEADDGKIGPNDVVYLMDDGGAFDTSLTFQKSGLPGKPITLMPRSGDTVTLSPSSGNTIRANKQYIIIDCDYRMTLISSDSASYQPVIRANGSNSSDYLTVNACTIIGPGSSSTKQWIPGIHTASDNFTITNNTVSHTGPGIVYTAIAGDTGPHYGIISGNVVHDVDAPRNGEGDGILVKGEGSNENNSDMSGVVIEKNWVYNFYDDAIDTFGSKYGTIQYNEIGPSDVSSSGNCNGIKLGGGGDSWAGSQTLRWNYIHDIENTNCPGGQNGITTNGSMGQRIYGNIVYNTNTTALVLDGHDAGTSQFWQVYNNILYGSSKGILSIRATSGAKHIIHNNIISGGSVDIDLNSATNSDIFYGGYNILAGTGRVSEYLNNYDEGDGDITDDPDFTDKDNGDFTLQIGSPAIDAGAFLGNSFDKALLPGSFWPTHVVTKDTSYMDETRRDIGPYVYTQNGESSKSDGIWASAQKDGVFMRSGPSYEYKIIRIVDSGYPIEILEQKGQWVRIKDFMKQQGWTYKPLIDQTKTIVIKVGRANLRTGPNITYHIVAKLDYGTVMQVVDKSEKWLKVKNADGLEGWLFKELAWPSLN